MGWQTERYEDANEGFADAALPDGAKPRPQYIDMGSSGHMPSSQGVRRGLGPAHRVPGVAGLATQARLEQTRIIAAANQAADRTVGSRSEEPLSYLRVGPRGAPMGLVKRRDPYWASNVSGGLMSGWAGLGWDLVFGAATLLVAFNYRDAAWRIHGFMANTVGINRLLTPTMVRVTCGVLAAVSIVGVAVSAARL
ncbi:hypothetical protein ACFV5M_07525 [Streptomyces albidoflavus]